MGPGHISRLVNRPHHKTAQVTEHTQPHQHPLLLWAHIAQEATSGFSPNISMKGNGAYERIHHQIDRLLKKQNMVIIICIITYGLVMFNLFFPSLILIYLSSKINSFAMIAWPISKTLNKINKFLKLKH